MSRETFLHESDAGQHTRAWPRWVLDACIAGNIFERDGETYVKAQTGDLIVHDGDTIVRYSDGALSVERAP
jgi:hypothetical protein